MTTSYTSLNRRHLLMPSLVLCLALQPGCAILPPVIQEASLLISSVSYLSTGKGPSDHAISIAAKKDCSFFRLFTLGPLCVPVTEETNRSLIARITDLFNEDEAQAVYSFAPSVGAVDRYTESIPVIPFEISE